jgi:two-component system phosphate regulon sensor histidine kinase PhoR
MKKTFKLLIVVSSVALLGIIFTQVFWVMNAVDMKEEHFDTQVGLSTKLIANGMFDYQVDISSETVLTPCDTALFNEVPIIDIINPGVLDSLVSAEFPGMEPGTDYVYGVYNTQDTSFIILNDGHYTKELIISPYQTNLTCLYRPDIYMLSLHFINKNMAILGTIYTWLLLSVVFLVAIILGYILIIYSHLKQKKLSEMKSDFINNMTHEFKTPLSTISLSSEMLLKPSINEYPYKVKRYAMVVNSENERLQYQVDHILHLAAIERDSIKLKYKPVRVNRLLNLQVEHFRMKLDSSRGEIHTDLNAMNDEIMADRDHLTNVVSNLIDNAIKYTRDEPRIVVSSRQFEDCLEIAVSDNGIGISKENQKLIFKKLYRVPTGDIHDVKGFGIGLYYVKTIVEAHGGRIKLQSEPGKGSTFTVYMPYNKKEVE